MQTIVREGSTTVPVYSEDVKTTSHLVRCLLPQLLSPQVSSLPPPLAGEERNRGRTNWEMRKKRRADPPLWTNTQRSLLELTCVHLFIKHNLNRQRNRHNCVASCWVFTSKNNMRKREEAETTGHERSKHFCDESEGDSQRDRERESARLLRGETLIFLFFSPCFAATGCSQLSQSLTEAWGQHTVATVHYLYGCWKLISLNAL